MMVTLITKMTMIIGVTILTKKRNKEEDDMAVVVLVKDLFDEFESPSRVNSFALFEG